MSKMIRSIEDIIADFSRKFSSVGGKNPLIFLDTGAIIDFERLGERYKHVIDKKFDQHSIFRIFENSGVNFYVTEGVLGESINHNSHHFINGRPEISQETLMKVLKMHSQYCDLLKIAEPNKNIEEVRLDTYWAGVLAFEVGHKKECRDPISYNDRELVSSAVWSKYLSMPLRGGDSLPSGVVVVSPDCHVINTINLLTGTNYEATLRIHNKFGMKNEKIFEYGGISAVSSR